MPKKYTCDISADELYNIYIVGKKTLKEMCPILGVRNTITASRILREKGISTNANARKAEKSKNGMSEDEFRSYLIEKYNLGFSMNKISKELSITPSAVRKYFVKYGIKRRSKTDTLKSETNPNWKGGKRTKSDTGYIEIYSPNHPNANKRNCVYEHQLIMEKHIGRYIRKGEVVHHIDGNKSNNDINNLMLLTNSDHIKLHAIMRRSKKLMEGG